MITINSVSNKPQAMHLLGRGLPRIDDPLPR